MSVAPYDLIPYISHPTPREAILDWFSSHDVSQDEKEAFVSTLINFDDRCNHFFSYQTYFLAAEAISLFPSSQADEIVGQLLKWGYAFCRISKSEWKLHPQALTIAARETLKRTDVERVANQLAEVVHTTDSLVVFRRAAEKLGRLNPGDGSAIAALEHLIQYSLPLRNHLETIEGLIAIDPQSSLIIPSLLEIVNSDETGFYILRDAIHALRDVAIRDEVVIRTIVEFLHRRQQQIRCQSDEQQYQFNNDDNIFFCNQSAILLGAIGVDSQAAILVLLELLRQSGFYVSEFYPSAQYFGWEAIEALGEIEIDDPTAIAELTQMLVSAQEPLVRCHIAAALLRIDKNNSSAMTVLMQILETVQTEVARLKLETPIRTRLRELPEYLLWRSADSLVRNNSNCQIAIETLVQLVQTLTPTTPCLSVIYSLLDLDSTNKLAINALIQLLDAKPDDFLFEMLWIFRSAEIGDELVINALTRLIRNLQSRTNRYVVAGALGVVDPGNLFAIETLIELLQSDNSDRSDWHIAQELGNIGISDERSIAALIKFVQTFQRTSDRWDRSRLTDCFKQLRSQEL
jgi:HEAT repeat protein